MEQKEKSRQSVEYIIKCAINEFAEENVNVTLNSICRKNNISKGKLYHHFSSKEDLICACICYIFDSMNNDIDKFERDDTLSVIENLHIFFLDRVQYFIESPNSLTALRLAYNLNAVIFTEASQKKISAYKEKWNNHRKKYIIDMLNKCDEELRISSEYVADLLSIIYENTFQSLEDKLAKSVKAGNEEDICSCKKQLIEYHDTIMSLILYGAINV